MIKTEIGDKTETKTSYKYLYFSTGNKPAIKSAKGEPRATINNPALLTVYDRIKTIVYIKIKTAEVNKHEYNFIFLSSILLKYLAPKK